MKNIYNCARISNPNIEKLNKNEIFVFGSNKLGEHKGGAAAFAHNNFNAKWGVGEGLTGKCYALPTMEGEKSFKKAVKTFMQCAKLKPNLIFLVTKVGCGIAGYSIEYVANLFKPALRLENVYLPIEFFKYY